MIFALFLALGTLSAVGQGEGILPCGNNSRTGAGGSQPPPADQPPTTPAEEIAVTGGDPDPPSTGGDPIVLYTGNEYWNVKDLEIWSPVGELPLRWLRHAGSRLPGSRVSYFGNGHSWRHGYQWELVVNETPTGRVATVADPYGSYERFHEIEGTNVDWTSETPAPTRRLWFENETAWVADAGGWRYRFEAWKQSGTSTQFHIMEFIDTRGVSTGFTYDEQGLLLRVEDPAGNWLEMDYEVLPQWSGSMATLAVIAEPATPGVWNTITFTEPPKCQFLRYLTPDVFKGELPVDGSRGSIAELEFLTLPANGLGEPQWCVVRDNPIVSIFGSPGVIHPDRAPEKAFDGDPDTSYLPAAVNGGFVGIDFGEVRKIVQIRFRSCPNTDMIGGAFQGSLSKPSGAPAIRSVRTSDGRSVTYEYTAIVDEALHDYVWQTLTAVQYGDGSRAEFTYSQVVPGSRPLIKSNIEPRYTGPFAKMKRDYFDIRLGTLGQVRCQYTFDGEVMSVLGVHNGYAMEPQIVYGWGATNWIRVHHDNGLTLLEVDALGRQTGYERDAASGRCLRKTDPLGRVSEFARTSLGNYSSVTLPDGTLYSWTRGAWDLPANQTIEGPGMASRTVTWTRDASNRVTRVDHPDGSFETFDYNALGQITAHRARDGGVTAAAYDPQGRIVSRTDPLGKTWTYAYNPPDSTNDFAANLVDAVTDPRGQTTAFLYTERGQIARVLWPDGSTRSMAYDLFGNLVEETDELGRTRTATYDDFKRPVSVTDPLGQTTAIAYKPGTFLSKPEVVTFPSGRKIGMVYDAELRLTARIDGYDSPVAATNKFQFDKVGNLIAAIEPGGGKWTWTYDNRDRRIAEMNPLSNTWTRTYDAAGNVLTETRPDGKAVTNEFDTMDRLLASTDEAGGVTRMRHGRAAPGDGGDRVVELTDAKGQVHVFEHDFLGRVLRQAYPDGSQETWAFTDDEAAGQPFVVHTTRSGATLSSHRNGRGWEVRDDWSDASTPDVERTYLANGLLASLVSSATPRSPQIALGYAYDAADRLLSETTTVNGQSAAVSYTYTADSQVETVGYPSGRTAERSYTARGQLEAVWLDPSLNPTPVAAYEYRLDGLVARKILANGTETALGWDAANRLKSIEHKAGEASLRLLNYGYSVLDRRIWRRVDGDRGDRYGYDALGQVTDVKYDALDPQTGTPTDWSRRVQYQWDPVGNRKKVTEDGVATTYAANLVNQYTTVGGAALSYDGNGNLATAPATAGPGGPWAYTYDAANRLIAAQSDAVRMEMVYDARNRCIERKTFQRLEGAWVASSDLWMGYDGWSLIEEGDALTGAIAAYVHGAQIDEVLARVDASGAVYYHADALGSTEFLTDAAGAVVERYRYDAFGLPTILDASGAPSSPDPRTSSFGNRFLFTGREWLSDLALYDYRHRVYSPALGRWLQPDPIRFAAGDVNLYRYCGNRSVTMDDPWGLRIVATYPSEQPVVDRALAYIGKAGFAGIIDQIQTGPDVVVDVVDSVSNKNKFSPPGSRDNPGSSIPGQKVVPLIIWSPSHSLHWKDKCGEGSTDAAVILYHELIHFWRWRDRRREYEGGLSDRTDDPGRWSNAEEKTVITRYENQLQFALGQHQRGSHSGLYKREQQPW
jgi:RHS repeat-associated protein